jgi:cytidine deaminase
MELITNEALIDKATAVVNAKKVGSYLVGDVGAALVTDTGNIYLGVCMDMTSGIGFCAEASAIAAMVTAGEYRIAKIVAVWKNEQGLPHVLPPCGRCREFIKQIDPGNLATEVIVKPDKVLTLADLLPYHDWFAD